MKHKALDYVRKLRAEKRQESRRDSLRPEEIALASDGTADDDPVAHAMEEEWNVGLRRALDRLPRVEQRVLKLKLQHMERSEIATELGMTYDAVRMALKRAWVHLDEQLPGSDGHGAAHG